MQPTNLQPLENPQMPAPRRPYQSMVVFCVLCLPKKTMDEPGLENAVTTIFNWEECGKLIVLEGL